jgi:sulfur-oxidizing protein SoxZ
MAGSISKNPFFSFRLKHCQPGDRISVQWVDNLGDSDRSDTIIEVV